MRSNTAGGQRARAGTGSTGNPDRCPRRRLFAASVTRAATSVASSACWRRPCLTCRRRPTMRPNGAPNWQSCWKHASSVSSRSIARRRSHRPANAAGHRRRPASPCSLAWFGLGGRVSRPVWRSGGHRPSQAVALNFGSDQDQRLRGADQRAMMRRPHVRSPGRGDGFNGAPGIAQGASGLVRSRHRPAACA